MASEGMIRVLVVHPSRLFREFVAFVLARQEAISVVATVARISEALGDPQRLRADVYIIDLGAPSRQGIEDTRKLRSRIPEAKILMTGVGGLESDVLACAESGAGGFLAEEASLGNLCDSLRAVAAGEAICSRKVAGFLFARLAQSAREREQRRILDMPRITPREREIVALIDTGLSNKEIAVRLRIEVQTVKNHVHNVLEKLHVDGRRELRQYIKEQGLRVTASSRCFSLGAPRQGLTFGRPSFCAGGQTHIWYPGLLHSSCVAPMVSAFDGTPA